VARWGGGEAGGAGSTGSRGEEFFTSAPFPLPLEPLVPHAPCPMLNAPCPIPYWALTESRNDKTVKATKVPSKAAPTA
jgi:hypothetical protein